MSDLRLSASDVASVIATKHPTYSLPMDFPRPNHDVERESIEEMIRNKSDITGP